MTIRIGILGGTFDPVHNGHLYLARELFKKLSLNKVIFMPAYIPPHKKGVRITSAYHRYNMVRLAIKGNSKFKVSDIEIRRRGRSYSVETLKELRSKYGPKAEIFFITGSDSLKDIDKWKDLKKILELCRFVVVKRPHFGIKDSPDRAVILHINAKDISSSDIRNRIKKSLPIKRLMPAEIAVYIKKHGLYKA